MRKILATAVLLVGGWCVESLAFADDNCGDGFTTVQFMRDDLTSLKKNLETAIAAIPEPKAPYSKANQNWNLPGYTCQDKSGMRPIDVSYTAEYNTEGASQKLAQEYQKQLMAAEAKGDYESVMKITQEMQSRVMSQASATQGLSEIQIRVDANTAGSGTIDPDAVMRDGEGFIALRNSKDGSGNEQVSIWFDPVALKNAHQLASFDMNGDYRVDSKLALWSIEVSLSGPASFLDDMVKNIDAAKVLGTLTTSRKKLNN